MITWLLVIILAYILFGVASLGDKLFLSGKPNPKSYTFYVGVFGLFMLLFIPFIKFGLPATGSWMWIILDALVYVIGLYTMYSALERFEVSRVISIIGAIQPILIFILAWIFFGGQSISLWSVLAFLLLFLGSLVISIEKNIKLTAQHIKITFLCALMFSLDYIFAKLIFVQEPFLQGLIWTRIVIFLMVLVFLFKKSARQEIFSKEISSEKNAKRFFMLAQASGGIATILQSFAIALAPVAFLATINALRGVQYIVLFILTLLVSVFLPKILREELSKKIIIQKVTAIFLIAVGLVFLFVK